MDSDASENNSVPLDKTNDELQRSRSPLETVAEEAEGYQPILVTPATEWKSLPLLVEDSSRVLLAPSLQLALRHFFTHCGRDVIEISRSDLMIVLIYVIALETGLIPKGGSLPPSCRPGKHHTTYRSFDRRLVNHFASRLPLDWFGTRAGPYRFELELVHESATSSNLSCTLVALSSGDLLIVNLLPFYGQKAGFSVTVPISFHVPAVNGNRLPLCYQNLSGLSVKLKNELFVPFRNHMYSKFVFTISPSLRGIPQELVARVMEYLDEPARRKLMEVLTMLPAV
ncbi:AGAP006814-PA [Anopheles gambiae str. PEST]|uniref:AGAP006814-PA n=1 Tax=Anopheles gambiae TaxID=7165 RepID=Q5TWH5_ANOGA|nr:AGAP006814-PA [Anopheles gambiae str. PEST]